MVRFVGGRAGDKELAHGFGTCGRFGVIPRSRLALLIAPVRLFEWKLLLWV